jgi:hypothetical protein
MNVLSMNSPRPARSDFVVNGPITLQSWPWALNASLVGLFLRRRDALQQHDTFTNKKWTNSRPYDFGVCCRMRYVRVPANVVNLVRHAHVPLEL